MLFKYRLKTAYIGISTNKSRSLLTILGIVIGITSIIIVMSIGRGAENLILGQIEGLGATTISIDPGKKPEGPSSFAELYTDSLRPKDVEALKKPSNVQGLRDISPMVMQPASLVFENETERATVLGSAHIVVDILNVYPEEGQFFTEDDVKQKSRVVVLGSKVKEDLFGLSDAVGQTVRIKGQSFRVIGVFPESGTSIMSVDEMVLTPYTAAQQYLTGTNYYNSIMVRAEAKEMVPRVVHDIEATLRESHGISDPDNDDFYVSTPDDAAEIVGTITAILTALLGSVAGISLVVGGIGIMNIMLVSVSERTREIGLRKALGATEKDILYQFLFEAIILTGFGGVIGIALGAGISFLASWVLGSYVAEGWEFAFPISAALLGLGVSAVIGLIFGIYPAKRAAQKSPMEALRYE
ncbi:MAG TPA: ABC transporter permease [Candidatus Paceibacterota bacterium]|nr:ABC transporter permease [Candidatus Paceibacterota bacterium]